ncbi:SDR family oxidoreductase [Bacteroidota bacterium]
MKKNIVVTGGSKGIGKSIVEKFASEGFHIVTCSRDEDALSRLKEGMEKNHPEIKVHVKKSDLSRKEDIFEFGDFVKDQISTVDVLVNNTGVFIPGEIHKEEEGTLEKLMNTNLYSAYYLTKTLVGSMIEQKSGHIFNMCSVASLQAYPNGGSYSISKFALYGMTKALREEMKPHNIRVTAVLPGATLTSSWNGVDLPSERFMKSEDIAEAIFSTWKLSDRTVVEDLVLRPQLGDI